MGSRRMRTWSLMCGFLPNPYYIEDLRPKTGKDKEVRDYVMSSDAAVVFLEKLVIW